MSDLISRADAIKHLKKRLYETALNSNTEHPYYEEIADNRIDVWMNEVPSVEPERKQMNNKEWIDFLSVQFDISRTSAREMLHGMMQCKKEDNFKKQFNRRREQE